MTYSKKSIGILYQPFFLRPLYFVTRRFIMVVNFSPPLESEREFLTSFPLVTSLPELVSCTGEMYRETKVDNHGNARFTHDVLE